MPFVGDTAMPHWSGVAPVASPCRRRGVDAVVDQRDSVIVGWRTAV
jgi:hypothetical protein